MNVCDSTVFMESFRRFSKEKCKAASVILVGVFSTATWLISPDSQLKAPHKSEDLFVQGTEKVPITKWDYPNGSQINIY